MDIEEVFSDMKSRALRDETLRAELLDTKKAADPLSSFCGICRRFGHEIYPMEIVEDGESMVAEMMKYRGNIGKVWTQAFVEGEVVAEAELTFALT